jgi:septum formation protein
MIDLPLPLILGSSSPFRALELTSAGYAFTVLAADIDEKLVRHDDLRKLPLLVAEAKAKALLPKITEPSLLITADVVVVANGELREKPTDELQARTWLASYAKGIPAIIYTGLVVTNTQTGKQASGIDECPVHWNHIPEEAMEKIIADGTIFQTAGGFTNEIAVAFGKQPLASGDRRRGIPLYLFEDLVSKVL